MPGQQQRGYLVIFLILLFLLGGFCAAIILSWEAPAPLAKIEKILPESVIGGGVPISAQAGLEPREAIFVAPSLTQPIAEEPEILPALQANANTNAGRTSIDFSQGPIVIDGTN